MGRNRKTIILLSGITFLGILLRLWGAGHGVGDKLFTHPDEIPFAYSVNRFSHKDLSSPLWHFSPLWTYLNTLGVYLYSFFEGILKYPFGIRHSFIEIPDIFRIVLIGRMVAGVLGGMTIAVVYLIGKRLFNEKIGLLSAGTMAVLYLHVVHSHFAYVDVPQTFFLSLSFYFMVRVSLGEAKDDGGKKGVYNLSQATRHSFLAGIFLALAVATKISAAPGFITLVLAHYLKERSIKGLIRSRYLYISISGLIIGYGLCTPWYWIKPMSFIEAIRGLLSLLYGEFGQPFDIFGGIKNLGVIIFDSIGLSFIILFSFILIFIFIKKDWRVFFILSFPLAYLPFFLLAAWQDEREFIPLIPFLAIVMAYGIYRVAEVIPFRRKGAIMVVLSLFFILPSLWISLKTDYFLWHKDTRVLAAEWIRENIPGNARIGMEGHIYYNVSPIYYDGYEINGEFSKIPAEEIKRHIDFIVISSFIYDGLGPEKKRYYDSLKEKSRPVKVFNTFPSYFSNPRIEIYKLSHQGKVYPSIIPKTYSEKDSYYMSFSEGVYGKEPLSFWIWPGTRVKRVLVPEKRLETIGVFIYNGSEKTVLKVKTTYNRKKITLEPYERRAVLLNPSRSFPFIEYIYNISIGCGKEGGAFVSILTDPKRIANALLESGDWEQAISSLSKNVSMDQEGWSLLGLAYSMGGRYKEALEAFRKGLSPPAKELLSDKEWEVAFERLTNIDPAFLRDSLTVSYGIDQLYNKVGRRMDRIAHFDPVIDRPGFLLFGPYKRFPAGAFKAVFNIRTIGPGKGPSARIDVFNGEVILAEKTIKDNTKGRFEEFSLNFYNEDPDSALEFRVEALGGRELWVEEIRVFPDIHGHYKRFLGMIHHYWGFSAGELGLREEAMEHFRIAESLGYRDAEALYRRAGVYEKMGMKEEAIRAYRKVIDYIPNQIDALFALRRLTTEIEIEEKIEALTPGYEIRQGFGDLIEFIGYSIDKKRVHPGEGFNISYFWRSLKKIRSSYSIFVHFRKDGITVFQNDHLPSVQTNKWRWREVIREDYRVRVPSHLSAGKYDIIIGVWDPAGTKERLKLKGKTSNEIKIGEIEIS